MAAGAAASNRQAKKQAALMAREKAAKKCTGCNMAALSSLLVVVVSSALTEGVQATTNTTCSAESSKTALSCADESNYDISDAASSWCSGCIQGDLIKAAGNCDLFDGYNYGEYNDGADGQCCKGVGTGAFHRRHSRRALETTTTFAIKRAVPLTSWI